MKGLISLMLVVLLLANINCVQTLNHSLNYSDAITLCKAILLKDDVDFIQEESGVLIANKESIRFNSKENIIDIPYDKITFWQLENKEERFLPNIPDPYFWHYTKRKTSPSFLDALLTTGLILIIIGITVYLVVKANEQRICLSIYFNINNEDNLATFEIPKHASKTIYMILNEKTEIK